MAEKQILICGGCGFIGSNFARYLHSKFPASRLIIYDLLTYAGSLDNLEDLKESSRVDFIQGDICDQAKLKEILGRGFDLAINFAAETHVDRSLYYTGTFVRTNILGTEAILTACRETRTPLLQISTDEVYGPAQTDRPFSETAALNPTSPYAASKAASDLLVLATIKTFRQPAAIVRTCNNFGPRQFPEKLIPYFLYLIESGKPLPLYGDGLQRRTWLLVDDFCSALARLVVDFPDGDVFNIGSTVEVTNTELVQKLIELTGRDARINHVVDRPGHDRRYLIDSSKYVARYGKIEQCEFETGLKQTIAWYRSNPGNFSRLRDQSVQKFQQEHYQNPR